VQSANIKKCMRKKLVLTKSINRKPKTESNVENFMAKGFET
jgi:hypothetical protein